VHQHLQRSDLSLTPQAGFGAGATGVVRLLIERGLVDLEEVLNGEIRLRDGSRRNRSAILTRADGTGFAVKERARHEFDQYRILETVSPLTEFVPRLRSATAEPLVVSVEPGAVDLHQHHLDGGPIDPAIAAALGRALGLLHSEAPEGMRRTDDSPPDIFEIGLPDIESLRDYTGGVLDVVRAIQGHTTLSANVRAAESGWSNETVIHGDVKWPNIVVVPCPHGGTPGVRLIDWEHSGGGDRAWDVGSAIASYLSCWIVSMPPLGDSVGDAVRSAAMPLDALRPSIAAVWHEYAASARLANERRRRLLDRAIVLCAVRLIKSAFEESAMRMTMSVAAARHLQLAANILDDPEDAATRLLALSA
jgi:hypothetical protein